MTLEQFLFWIMLVLVVVSGIYLMIDNYGGWPILWYDIKKWFFRRKEH